MIERVPDNTLDGAAEQEDNHVGDNRLASRAAPGGCAIFL
jgi:hypothetical protein